MKLVTATVILATLPLGACSSRPELQRLALVYHAPAKVEMCADKTPSGIVHISSCGMFDER